MFNLYQSRALNRYEYISQVLEKGFDFNKDEYYDLNLDEIEWAASAEELNELEAVNKVLPGNPVPQHPETVTQA